MNTLDDLLRAARRELNSFATAFISLQQPVLRFHCTADQGGDAARATIDRVAKAFLTQCANHREPLIRNRVREVSGGPLVCRFLVARVDDNAGQIAGVLIVFNNVDDVPFSKDDAAKAVHFAELFSKAVAVPRDAVGVPRDAVGVPRVALTGLLTRAGFEEQFAIHAHQSAIDATATLLYGDIDHMQVINDLWGFSTGDEVIIAIARDLEKTLEPHNAVVGRSSGNGFVVLLPECDLERGRRIAEELRIAIAGKQFGSYRLPIMLSMSWGIATSAHGEEKFEHMFAAAESAAKLAKEHGRNRLEVYHDAEVTPQRRREDVGVIAKMRAALEEDCFQVFGQPIAPLLHTDETRRYELLVRLVDQRGKLILPDQFMPIATRYRMLPLLDRCVIGDTLARMRTAAAVPGFKPLALSLNISAQSMSEAGFLEWLENEIVTTKVPGEWLTFELNEQAAVENFERTQQLLECLKSKGCKLSLDDFGAGLGRLEYLTKLEISSIKIDGSLVREVLENKRAENLVQAFCKFASALGIEAVAKSVETPAICMRLIELGVQFGQGFAIGRPVLLERILNPFGTLAQAS